MSVNKNKLYWMHSFISFALMFGFGFLPPIEPITAMGMKVLGAFLGLLYGWMFIELGWPSLFGVLALSMSGCMTMDQILVAGIGSSTFSLVLFMLIFAALVDSVGGCQYIATYCITRKWTAGRPWLFITLFLFAAYAMGAAINSVPVILVFWAILYSVCKQCGYKPFDSFSTFMAVGVFYSSVMGLALFPFKTMPLIVLGTFEKLGGPAIDYLSFVLFTLPLTILGLIVYILMGKFVFRIDVTALKKLKLEEIDQNVLQLNTQKKMVLWALVLLIVLMLVPSLLPKELAITQILAKWGAVGIPMLFIGFFALVKINGQPILPLQKVAASGVKWDVLLLVMAVFPFSSALQNADCGITAFVLEQLAPILSGQSVMLFLVAVMVISLFLTNLLNNALAGSILLPVVWPFLDTMGIDPVMMVMLVIIVLNLAMLTPAASPMAAVCFSNSDWVRIKDIYRICIPNCIITFILFVILGIPLANIIFL